MTTSADFDRELFWQVDGIDDGRILLTGLSEIITPCGVLICSDMGSSRPVAALTGDAHFRETSIEHEVVRSRFTGQTGTDAYAWVRLGVMAEGTSRVPRGGSV